MGDDKFVLNRTVSCMLLLSIGNSHLLVTCICTLILCVIVGVDDAPSECDLDTGVTFDAVIDNSSSECNNLDCQLKQLVETVKCRMQRGVTVAAT